jgi:hypothetical protein
MYQPQVPLVQLSPAFRTARLAEIELGHLILLRAGVGGGAGLGMRADALSARGDLSEGLLRLSGGPTRFERCGLDDVLVAIDIDYVLEADLTSIAARAPISGDLIVAPNRPAAGVFVANPWNGSNGLLDLASAVIRSYVAPRAATQTALSWKLTERAQRSRVLLAHEAPEGLATELPRRAFGEDSD